MMMAVAHASDVSVASERRTREAELTAVAVDGAEECHEGDDEDVTAPMLHPDTRTDGSDGTGDDADDNNGDASHGLEVVWATAAVGVGLLAVIAAAVGSGDTHPLIAGDAPVLALLMLVLHLIFAASSSENRLCRRFFAVVPSILLCYFVPGLLAATGAISADETSLPRIASHLLLPSCLALLTVGTDVRAVIRLGPKALFVFAAGTIGVVLGGPVALLAVGSFVPAVRTSDETWRALATLAGSWIGGSANQLAMKEIFDPPAHAFSQAVAADVACSNILMACLLAAARSSAWIDERVLGAEDAAADLRLLASDLGKSARRARRPVRMEDLSAMAVAGFGTAGACSVAAEHIAGAIGRSAPALANFSLTNPFFWTVVLATSCGIAASFTPARRLEGVGASRLGSYLLFVLIATVGMQLDLRAVWQNPVLFLIGAIWLAIHAAVITVAGRIVHAPLFYVAVGSMANVGGAATAPVVASAFFPELASVGALLAVLGYSIGTYAAWITGSLLQFCHHIS